ncbi:hypothetical protein KP509_29G052900 [Ceratopteris richardii]|nr:hypothetical protein KP509_29G052900 [Ceratopteris richardii]
MPHQHEEQRDTENTERPCRRKWRRYPRESVLRSLRGGREDERFIGHAANCTDKLNRNASSYCGPQASPKKAEPVNGGSIQQNTLGVCAGNAFFTLGNDTNAMDDEDHMRSKASLGCKTESSNVSVQASPGKETICSLLSDTETSEGFLHISSEERTVIIDDAISGGPGHGDGFVKTSLTLTPPPEKSFSLTSQAGKSVTPPMQPTQSPDFIKREGPRTLLPVDGICYAAPSALVKDRRKCKPRAVLTVDAGREVFSSAEADQSPTQQLSTQHMSSPVVASVEWMLEEKMNLNNKESPKVVSDTMDLCRMSFPRLSPSQKDVSPKQRTDVSSIQVSQKLSMKEQDSPQQALTSVSGYEWRTSVSDGVFSSSRTDTNTANIRRSIIFNDDGDGEKNGSSSEMFNSIVMHNVLFEEVPSERYPCADFSDDEIGDCLPVRVAPPPDGSPPFEYSLLNSLKLKGSANLKQRSWLQGSREEAILSLSGPTDSSLSSQEHERDRNWDANPFSSDRCNNVNSFLGQGQEDISSRIAMAKFLCNITATYLDDIATRLGKDRVGHESERAPVKKMGDNVEEISLEPSSLMEGRNRMMECCSLLRGLTLETSQTEQGSGTATECSVNQPSPSWKEDTADSLSQQLPRVGYHPTTKGSPTEQAFAQSGDVSDDYPLASSPACCLMKSTQFEVYASSPVSRKDMVKILPARRFFAVSYLAIALFVMILMHQKHVKSSRRPTLRMVDAEASVHLSTFVDRN